jgi:hypothetical protein
VLLRLKALLDDFSGPAVDAAATLVENAGCFLLRLPGALQQSLIAVTFCSFCFVMLLDDFSGPAVVAAATLVENAGRFLLQLPGVLHQ